jgi:multiple sugar transport system substrate-binding protein
VFLFCTHVGPGLSAYLSNPRVSCVLAVSLADYDVMAGFKAGTIGMAMLGSYLVTAARSASSVGTSLRTAPVPGWLEKAPTPARLGAQCLGIGVSSAHADGAWAFIQYYTSAEPQLAFAKAGVMPSRQSSYANPFFENVEQGKEMMQWRGYATQYGRFELLPNDFTQLSEDLVQAVQEVLARCRPQTALTAAARQYDSQHGG